MKDFADRHVPALTRKHLIGLAQAVLEHVPYISNSTTVQGLLLMLLKHVRASVRITVIFLSPCVNI